MNALGNQMSECQTQKDAPRKGIGQAQPQLVFGNFLRSERDQPANHVNRGQHCLEDDFPNVERNAVGRDGGSCHRLGGACGSRCDARSVAVSTPWHGQRIINAAIMLFEHIRWHALLAFQAAVDRTGGAFRKSRESVYEAMPLLSLSTDGAGQRRLSLVARSVGGQLFPNLMEYGGRAGLAVPEHAAGTAEFALVVVFETLALIPNHRGVRGNGAFGED
mmetsp:Transcript_6171/g.15377  ORF Transcript_6171/g.15377 Transcript_6171/m.15377 type:complete len:219 (-) Transcript_6171:140-796(-)